MKNCEKFTTADERDAAFGKLCLTQNCPKCVCNTKVDGACNTFVWLELEVDEEKPLPCPFCGGKTGTNLGQLLRGEVSHWVDCLNPECMYKSANCTSRKDAIAAHNRICKEQENVYRELQAKLKRLEDSYAKQVEINKKLAEENAKLFADWEEYEQ